MGNNTLFKALSNETRIKIVEILLRKELHLSELARSLGISVPVTSRHIKILEKAGIIKKRVVGNVHLLSVTINVLEHVFDAFTDELLVEIGQGDTLLDALKQLPGFEIQKVGDNQYITSINGERGHYIYQIDGKTPNISIDRYKPKKNVTLEFKKLIAVNKKKIKVEIAESNESF